MLSGLMVTAFLMGVGGIPHCTAMCGAACAAVLRKPVPLPALLGRAIGYALLGAVAAASTSGLALWAQQSAVLQPLWLLAQLSALSLGLWLAVTATMPARLDQWGQGFYRRLQAWAVASPRVQALPAASLFAPLLAGMMWAALPCGLLYGAVMVAALANGPVDGALVMVAFALPSALGLWAAPWLLVRMGWSRSTLGQVTMAPVPIVWLRPQVVLAAGDAKGVGGAPSVSCRSASSILAPVSRWRSLSNPRWAIRISGLMLAVMSAWAVYHRLVTQWQAWCA
ncbi:MAG: sulfite exporter TauE/SafE family protein [Pseudomonadota bacterium]